MENSYTLPFSLTTTTTTTTTTTLRLPSMGLSQNSEFSFYDEPMNLNNFSSTPSATASNSQFDHASQFVAPSQNPQLPYTTEHQMEQADHSFALPVNPFFQGQNGSEFGSCFMQTDEVSVEQERNIPDSYRTKVARIRRKLARQRSLILQRNAPPSGSSSSNQEDSRILTSFAVDSSTDVNNTQRDLYKFCTPENKRLKVLVRKELKNSDVGSLGRIVVPKREAEVNLPILSDKEGIHLLLKDLNSNRVWTLKYKFWSNNKSRMYVLESTGDFVKQNGLETGDSLILYEDESKDLYFSITKAGGVAANHPSNQYWNNENSGGANNDHIYMPFTCQSRDEEETSLELLIEQLKHKEQEANNLMMSWPMDTAAYSHKRLPEESATTFQTSPRGTTTSADDITISMDDCYGGLGVLPDFHNYNFSI